MNTENRMYPRVWIKDNLDGAELVATNSHYTYKNYCGHWADADLARTLEFKKGLIGRTKFKLQELQTEYEFIMAEQSERASKTKKP